MLQSFRTRSPRGHRAHWLSTLALVALTLTLGACGLPGTIATGGTLPPPVAAPAQAALPPVRFPRDEAPHTDLTEWWYYTGHLQGTDARGHAHSYGFELTFFQTLRGGFSPYYAAHFAISDVTAGTFYYDQRAGFEPSSVIPAGDSASGFTVALDTWAARGLNGHDHIQAASKQYSLQADVTATKPVVLHAGSGIITYGPAGFSYYYSRPRMQVSGTLTDHGTPITVTGQAWMDHQWGNFVSLIGSGWDWYSLQLSDNTEYMLYIIRDAQKRPVSVFGTAVAADGTATEIAAQAIAVQSLSTWKSPATGGTYPSGWSVSLPTQHLTLTLTPLLRDQELVTAQSTGVAYWEGAVGISGQRAGTALSGEGYVELTGYATIAPASAGALVP